MKNNVEIEVRERGKVVARRESHNIWTQSGKSWLGHLVSYSSFSPDTFWGDLRLKYMGFGIGGVLQTSALANVPPLSVDYPGGATQTNLDDRVERLERHILVSPGSFFKQLGSVDLVSPYHLRLTVSLSADDLNLSGMYLSLPLSEVGLFPGGVDLNSSSERCLGYDVFDPVPKSLVQDMTVRWTLRL